MEGNLAGSIRDLDTYSGLIFTREALKQFAPTEENFLQELEACYAYLSAHPEAAIQTLDFIIKEFRDYDSFQNLGYFQKFVEKIVQLPQFQKIAQAFIDGNVRMAPDEYIKIMRFVKKELPKIAYQGLIIDQDLSGAVFSCAFGKFYQSKDELGKGVCKVAYKGIQLDEDNFRPVAMITITDKEELEFLKELGGGPGLVKVLGIISDHLPPIVIEEIYNGTFVNLLTKKATLHNSKKADYLMQLSAGLHFMHSKGITHRDIKPENILIKGETVVVNDFGLAIRETDLEKRRRAAGAPLYMPPELHVPNEHPDTICKYSAPSQDIWGLSCLTWLLFNKANNLPGWFHDMSYLKKLDQIPISTWIPKEEFDPRLHASLLKKMFCLSPNHRLRAELAHNGFKAFRDVCLEEEQQRISL